MTETGNGLAFVVGHYKSGSTWLINLLSIHPEIRGVSETHIFRYAFESPSLAACTDVLFSKTAWSERGKKGWLHRRLLDLARAAAFWRRSLSGHSRPTTLRDLTSRDQRRLRQALAGCQSPEDYCRCFFRSLWDGLHPGKCLVEKTPTNIFEVPRIRRVFPDAKLIAIYRDGRDVVVSDKYFRAIQGYNGYTLRDSVQKWRRAMEAQLEYAPAYEVLTLSYESLLADPAQGLRQVLSHLGLPQSEPVIADMIRGASFEFITGRKRGVENTKSFYRKGAAGDWVQHFTKEDKQLFEEQAGHLLVKLGYEATAECDRWRGMVPAGGGN